MIKTLIGCLVLQIVACGGSANQKCSKTIHVFRTPHAYNFFELKINEDFKYSDTVGIETTTPLAFSITQYCAKSDTIRFKIKINERDTAFNYIFDKSDSLLIGLSSDKRFVLFNENEYIWRED